MTTACGECGIHGCHIDCPSFVACIPDEQFEIEVEQAAAQLDRLIKLARSQDEEVALILIRDDVRNLIG